MAFRSAAKIAQKEASGLAPRQFTGALLSRMRGRGLSVLVVMPELFTWAVDQGDSGLLFANTCSARSKWTCSTEHCAVDP